MTADLRPNERVFLVPKLDLPDGIEEVTLW